jgi:hypothetical protein
VQYNFGIATSNPDGEYQAVVSEQVWTNSCIIVSFKSAK